MVVEYVEFNFRNMEVEVTPKEKSLVVMEYVDLNLLSAQIHN